MRRAVAKKKSLKGLGTRYGIKIRKQYTKIHLQLKQKRACPECGALRVSRVAVGIWSCKKCGYTVAGTAYNVEL